MNWKDFKYDEWKEKDEKFDHIEFENNLAKFIKTVKTLDDLIKLPNWDRPPWKPNALYNKEGDMLEIFLSDEEGYMEWLCPEIQIILSHETGEVIGINVNNIKKLTMDQSVEEKEGCINDPEE